MGEIPSKERRCHFWLDIICLFMTHKEFLRGTKPDVRLPYVFTYNTFYATMRRSNLSFIERVKNFGILNFNVIWI